MARLWDAKSGMQIAQWGNANDNVHAAVFDPAGHNVFIVSEDGVAQLWDAETGKHVIQFEGFFPNCISAAFAPDGWRVFTFSQNGTVSLLDVDSGQLLAAFHGHESTVTNAILSPDGLHVLTASNDDTVRLWNARDGQLLGIFEGSDGIINYGAFGPNIGVFSPDGQRVLTTFRDNIARLWDVKSKQPLIEFKWPAESFEILDFSPHAVIFSPDGRRILTTQQDGTARLWSLLPAGRPPPSWFGEFLATLAGGILGTDGRITPLPSDKAQHWSESLVTAAHQQQDDDYLRVLRWRMSVTPERTVDPYVATCRDQPQRKRLSLKAAIGRPSNMRICLIRRIRWSISRSGASKRKKFSPPDSSATTISNACLTILRFGSERVRSLHEQKDSGRVRQALQKLEKLAPDKAGDPLRKELAL